MSDDFDDVTRWCERSGGAWEGVFPRSWGQGRTVFGGISAAVAARAMRPVVPDERRLLSLDSAFLGPVSVEQPCRLEVRVMRAGKSITTIEATLTQARESVGQFVGTFGAPRTSGVRVSPSRVEPLPASGTPLEHVDGVTPRFLRHFDMEFAVGAPPFSGGSEARLGGYCRHRTRAGGDEATLGLLDAWPVPALAMVRGPAVASTVRWTAHFARPAAASGARHFFESSVVAGGDGYASTLGHLYMDTGELVAWSEQLVAVFDR